MIQKEKGDWVVFIGTRATLIINIYELFLINCMCYIIACRSWLLTLEHVGAYVYFWFKMPGGNYLNLFECVCMSVSI